MPTVKTAVASTSFSNAGPIGDIVRKLIDLASAAEPKCLYTPLIEPKKNLLSYRLIAPSSPSWVEVLILQSPTVNLINAFWNVAAPLKQLLRLSFSVLKFYLS
jgi:hypothetical protein